MEFRGGGFWMGELLTNFLGCSERVAGGLSREGGVAGGSSCGDLFEHISAEKGLN